MTGWFETPQAVDGQQDVGLSRRAGRPRAAKPGPRYTRSPSGWPFFVCMTGWFETPLFLSYAQCSFRPARLHVMVHAAVHRPNVDEEYFFHEGCFIVETLNNDTSPELSIARARVTPGAVTQPHALRDTVERYLIHSGEGIVYLGNDELGQRVAAGDVVVIPAGVRQYIHNTGSVDLVFHAICIPRFVPESYTALS